MTALADSITLMNPPGVTARIVYPEIAGYPPCVTAHLRTVTESPTAGE
jgi:hypothetical protein